MRLFEMIVFEMTLIEMILLPIWSLARSLRQRVLCEATRPSWRDQRGVAGGDGGGGGGGGVNQSHAAECTCVNLLVKKWQALEAQAGERRELWMMAEGW